MINHDSIEVSDRIFGFNTPAQREFNYFFREKAFDLCVKHIIDLIFTYVAAFDMKEEIEYLKKIENQFVKNGGNFYFVELSTTIDTRLERNKTPHRLEKKLQKKRYKME